MQKTSLREKMENLVLIGSFIEDLYKCAAEPTEEKVIQFHGEYGNRNKIAEIKEAIPFKTWGDQQILHDGLAALEKIGNSDQLSEVAVDIKSAALNHFRKDLINFITDPTNANIADFFNDYNDKLENIRTLTCDEKLVKNLQIIFGILKSCEKLGGPRHIEDSSISCNAESISKLWITTETTMNLNPHIYAIRSYLSIEIPQEEIAAEASLPERPQSFVEREEERENLRENSSGCSIM